MYSSYVNATEASCTTTAVAYEESQTLTMTFDNAERKSHQEFEFVPNPVILDVEDPNSIIA